MRRSWLSTLLMGAGVICLMLSVALLPANALAQHGPGCAESCGDNQLCLTDFKCMPYDVQGYCNNGAPSCMSCYCRDQNPDPTEWICLCTL